MREGSADSLPQWLEIIMTLAEADASTGWVSAHGNICAGLIYASAEPRFRDEFFADPGAYAAWSNLPRVKVKEQDDGIRITGSWGFESGCTAATFVGGMVTLSPLAEGGPPRMVAALAPVSEAKIEETWDPVGLAGTGSHDVHFDDVFVPWHRTFPGLPAFPSRRIRPRFSCRGHGSSRSAPPPLTWALRVERSMRPATSCAARPTATRRGRCSSTRPHSAAWRQPKVSGSPVARACAKRWRRCGKAALRGEPATADMRINARVAAVTAVQRGAEIVRAAYDASGASAVRRAGALQRLMREASCLTHHISANQFSYELTGRVRCGIDELSFRI